MKLLVFFILNSFAHEGEEGHTHGGMIPGTSLVGKERAEFTVNREQCKSVPCSTAPVSCCSAVNVTGLDKTESQGIYYWNGTLFNDRPLYLMYEGKVAIWQFGGVGNTSHWIIGPQNNIYNNMENFGWNFIQEDIFCASEFTNSVWAFAPTDENPQRWVKLSAPKIECLSAKTVGASAKCVGAHWTDSEGESCTVYGEKNYCKGNGQIGMGWNSTWGTFEKFNNTDDDARKCVECGCDPNSELLIGESKILLAVSLVLFGMW